MGEQRNELRVMYISTFFSPERLNISSHETYYLEKVSVILEGTVYLNST